MKKRNLFKIILVSFIFFVGCMSIGSKFDMDKIQNIKRCTTTEKEIRDMFGKPYEKGIQSGYSTLTYWYSSVNAFGKTTNDKLIIFINNAGIVVDYTLNPTGLVEILNNCRE